MRKIFHRFNMVEIVLAIGVVAFGITGVMALLPPALNANRDVTQETFADEAISKTSYFLSGLKWSDIQGFPTTQPNGTDDYSPYTLTASEIVTNSNCYTQPGQTDLLYFSSPNGVQVHLKVWRGNIPEIWDGDSSHDEGTEGYRLYMLYSWPVTATKLSNRQQRLVIYDTYKHQYKP